MGKRGWERRIRGEEPYFPSLMHRPYGTGLSKFNLAEIDVAALRWRLGLSQTRFAHRFGFPLKTLRNWEQGVNHPRGSALALLHVINYNPGIATRAILRAKVRLPNIPPGALP